MYILGSNEAHWYKDGIQCSADALSVRDRSQLMIWSKCLFCLFFFSFLFVCMGLFFVEGFVCFLFFVFLVLCCGFCWWWFLALLFLVWFVVFMVFNKAKI